MAISEAKAYFDAASRRAAGVFQGGGLEREQARRLDRRRHVGQHPLHHLVLADRHAERLALARVGYRAHVSAGRDADGLGGDADASTVQRGQRDLESLALGADTVRDRHPALVEDQLGGVGGADPELVLLLADGEAGVPFSTTKALMPRWAWARSVCAKTSANEASRPLVMNSLRPVMT
jgi:hypothetical protein